jgi:hypothetical protein
MPPIDGTKSITAALKLSRPTVRKHFRRHSEPVYQRHKQPTPMLEAFQEKLETWLRTGRLLPPSTSPPAVCSRGCAPRGTAVPTQRAAGRMAWRDPLRPERATSIGRR